MQSIRPARFGGAILSVCLLLVTAGCYKATFISNPQVVRGVEHDQWNSFFLWGLVGEETLDVRLQCAGGQVAQVRTGANVLTGLVSFVTLGIYAPRMAYVWCAGNQASSPSTTAKSNAMPPAGVTSLAIFGDRQGRPVRVEMRRGSELESVSQPAWIEGERAWRVSFVSEVAR